MQATERHAYRVGVTWDGNRGNGTLSYTSYDRRFRVLVEGKPELVGSADPAFRGDSALHNPEEFLIAAVASCHMLFYLALCARRRIVVLGYTDAANGELSVSSDGGGSFEGITLRPRVTVRQGSNRDEALALHSQAHDLCFIARSCRFPIRHEAEISVETEPPLSAGAAGVAQ